MRLSACLLAAATLAAAAPAVAQQQPPRGRCRRCLPPPPTSSWQAPQFLPQRNNTDLIFRNDLHWTRGEYETLLQASRGNNIPPQPLARVDLANRVSTLMELGRCTDAREQAREAGDRLMAVRARQLCRRDRIKD